MQRFLSSGWDTHKTIPDMYRIFVECDESQTMAIIAIPEGNEEAKKAWLPTEPEEMAQNEAFQNLAEMHLNECKSCSDWADANGGTIELTFVGREK